MIQKETFLRVVDNSGVKFVKCLQVAKSSNSSDGKIGDILVVSVKSMQKKRNISKIKRGDIFYAILIRTKNKIIKMDSQWLHFFENAVILTNKNLKPVANRIIGPVLRLLRSTKTIKLISMSSGFL